MLVFFIPSSNAKLLSNFTMQLAYRLCKWIDMSAYQGNAYNVISALMAWAPWQVAEFLEPTKSKKKRKSKKKEQSSDDEEDEEDEEVSPKAKVSSDSLSTGEGPQEYKYHPAEKGETWDIYKQRSTSNTMSKSKSEDAVLVRAKMDAEARRRAVAAA